MWPFNKRAEPTTLDEAANAALLSSQLKIEEITREKAMNIATVSACVSKISEDIAALPIKLYKRIDGRVEEVKDNRTFLLNADTGDALNGTEFKRALIRDYLMGKGGYAYINRTGNEIKSLHYVSNEKISFMANSDPIFKTYYITINGKKYQPYEFIKILRNTEDGRKGTSIVKEHQLLLSTIHASLKFEQALVATGGNKKGFLTSETTLSDGVMTRIKAAWRNMYSNNSENIVLLNKGMAFKEASNTSVEMQMDENKKTNADEVCKIFKMPVNILKGTQTEEDKTQYAQQCLWPVVSAIECSLNKDLLLETEKEDHYYTVDMSELTKGDIEKRYRAYEIASRNGFMQTDEIRFRENMPALGLKFIKLGLQDVLYDPETHDIYVPNMDAKTNLDKTKKKEQDDDRKDPKKIETEAE